MNQDRQRSPDDTTSPSPQSDDIPVVYRYKTYGLDEFNFINPKAGQTARAWINNRRGAWSLFVTGDNGTGKTSYAVSILLDIRAAFPSSASRFITPQVLEDILRGMVAKGSSKKAVFKQWLSMNPLVLDDIGAVRNTPHLTEQLTHLLMTRHANGKKTIITTNLTVAEFARHVDRRIASRLQEGMMIDFGDLDLRRRSEA